MMFNNFFLSYNENSSKILILFLFKLKVSLTNHYFLFKFSLLETQIIIKYLGGNLDEWVDYLIQIVKLFSLSYFSFQHIDIFLLFIYKVLYEEGDNFFFDL